MKRQSLVEEDRLLKSLFGQFSLDDPQQNTVSGALLEAVLRKLGADVGSVDLLFSSAAVCKDAPLDLDEFSNILGSGHGGKIYRQKSGILSFNCSLMLRRDTDRIVQALESPPLALAVTLAPRMQAMSNDDVMAWALAESLVRIDSVSFFPLSRGTSSPSVTVCVVYPSSAASLREFGYDLISKYGQTFLPMDQFPWGTPTHNAFIEGRLFSLATDKLTELGLIDALMPMIMYQGKGLLLKYHMPQPELKEGTDNPQASEGAVWTISVSDATPPEVLKIGMRGNAPLVVPWNPFATDVCIQEDEECFQGLRSHWVQIKDADYVACHFVCPDG